MATPDPARRLRFAFYIMSVMSLISGACIAYSWPGIFPRWQTMTAVAICILNAVLLVILAKRVK